MSKNEKEVKVLLATLIGKKAIYKITLPKVPVGNYWIEDENKGKKLVNIEAKDGNWQIASNNFCQIINPQYVSVTNESIKLVPVRECSIDKAILRPYSSYSICLGNSRDVWTLYCSEAFEDSFVHLDMKNTQGFYIGSSKQNHISYANKLVSSTHAHVFNNNGRWMIENRDLKYGTFVNNIPVYKEPRVLVNGDIIFIMGLKIIIMGNSIFINNPRNKVIYNKEYFSNNTDSENIRIKKEQDSNLNDETVELYSNEEYFSRSPRITNIIEEEKIKIDAPPQAQGNDSTPAILTIGSTLTMGLMMIFSATSTISSRLSGNSTPGQLAISIFTTLLMLTGMTLFPIMNFKWNKRNKRKYEEKRQTKYKEYLNSKERTIKKIMEKQRNTLFENYVSAEECTSIILEKKPRLWERKIEDEDFLSIRLGIGDVPLKIDIQCPDEQFRMEDDNLLELVHQISSNSKTLKAVPIVTSLVERNISAIISNDYEKYMQNIIIQLIAFQSYYDLKLVFLTSEANEKKWEFVKMLPHVWNNTRDFRFFASDYNDMEEISRYLEEELKMRKQNDKNSGYINYAPYYLIITDDYKKIEGLKILNEILNLKTNLGFSLLCITNDIVQLPNECRTFISLEKEKGMLFENELNAANKQIEIRYDSSNTFFFEKISQTISNIPIRYVATSSQMLLPNNYTFLEMYDVGLIEQLNVLERWRKNDSTLSLRAPIGIDSAGRHISLDIHEKAHGPHGLIAGSTGSRKK